MPLSDETVRILGAALGEARRKYASPNSSGVVGWGLGLTDTTARRVGLILLRDATATGDSPPSHLEVPVDGTHPRVPTRTVLLRTPSLPFPPVATPSTPPPGPGVPISGEPNRQAGAAGAPLTLRGFGPPRHFLTARHIFPENQGGLPVFLGKTEIGFVRLSQLGRFYDIAVVELHESAQREWSPVTPDRTANVLRIRAVQFEDLGTRREVFRPTLDRTVSCTIEAVSVSFNRVAHGRTIRYSNMILTSLATAPGDSGTPLFDREGGVLGISSFRTQSHSFFTNAWFVANDPVCRGLHRT
jgi:hypothetical protein